MTIDPVAQGVFLRSNLPRVGDTVVVGAEGESSGRVGVNGTPDLAEPNSGAAYVFVRTGAGWTQQAFLKASDADENHRFGFSVSVEGDRVVIGARDYDFSSGAVYIFVKSGANWTQ